MINSLKYSFRKEVYVYKESVQTRRTHFWSVCKEKHNCLSVILFWMIYLIPQDRSAGEESIYACLVGVCGPIGEVKFENVKELVW